MAAGRTSQTEAVDFSVVVANWNGEAFLARCLSSVLLSARQTERTFEIIVVDDASTDESPEIVRRQFPQVRLIIHDENRGFAITVNDGVEAARGGLVILLNNDIVVRPEFCQTLLKHFDDDGDALFGVTAKTLEWDSHRPNFLKMDAVWEKGDIALVWSDPPKPAPTHFLQAGACAFKRDRFLELGALEPLYAPGYWEDFDLSWRALARGWRILYDPLSPALHLGKASFRRRYGDNEVRRLTARNGRLFSWINLSDSRLLLSHSFWLPLRVGRDVMQGRIDSLRSLVRALKLFGGVVRCRRKRKGQRAIGDREILASVDTRGSQRSEN